VNLHPYQRTARAKVADCIRAGKRRILLCSPTGSGKTVMLGTMTRDAVGRGKRCLWLVNRREIVTQTVATLQRFGLEVGHNGRSLTAPVQVMTYQAALASGTVPPADVIFPDEAHHLAGRGEWINILRAYPEGTVVGATATPERGDGSGLDFFEELITVAQPMDLVDLWHQSGGRMGLVPCVLERPSRELDGLARTPAKATVMHKLRDHQQVCFAPHVLAAEQYVAQFRGCGIAAELVTGETDKDERDAIVARFKARQTRVLVNCQVFTEGTDLPEVEVITLAGKCGTIGSMIQKTGRGARPAPDKSRFVVLDLFGVTWSLGHPFEDRVYSLTGKGISSPKPMVRINVCKRCGHEMPEDGNTCTREGCGWTRPAPEVPKELNEKLERWEWRRGQNTDERVSRVAAWIRQARHEGRAEKAVAIAIYKYMGYFREKTCPREIISHAVAIANGKAWCATCQHSVGHCRCPKDAISA